MLRKALAFAAVSLITVAAMGTSAKAQVANPYELSLGGTASHGPDFDGVNGAIEASLGYYFTDAFEVGIKQSLTYSDTTGTGGKGSNLNAATRLFADYHFRLGDHGEWQPYIGANIGYVYGDSIKDTGEAGPEGGVKYYVNANTFIQLSLEYEFFFNTGSSGNFGDTFSDGQFVYGLGVGFRF
jgi:outer membrane protein W